MPAGVLVGETTVAVLNREQIRAAKDIKLHTVAVPEWGGEVKVRMLTARERTQFEQAVTSGRGQNRDVNMRIFREKLLALVLVDEQGNRLFNDQDQEDLEIISGKSASACERVVDVAMRMNGLSRRDVESLTGNSETTENGSSPSS